MRSLFWIATIAATTSAQSNFGDDACTYSPEVESGYVDVVSSQEQFVTTIPAGISKIYVRLSANADLDTKLYAADGTVLLAYRPYTNWCVGCSYAQRWSYHGMNFAACMDYCYESVTMGPYYDGQSYYLPGSSYYGNEWVTIDTTTEELTLAVVGYATGAGTVQWLWDCPPECGFCVAATSDPTSQPTRRPVPDPSPFPTRHPIPHPTTQPTEPSPKPSIHPTPRIPPPPTQLPTLLPTTEARPSVEPTPLPTPTPTGLPTIFESPTPTMGVEAQTMTGLRGESYLAFDYALARSLFFAVAHPLKMHNHLLAAALYRATGGAQWINKENWLDPLADCKTWYGVGCNNGQVTQLFLNDNGLAGTLPSELGVLVGMTTHLDLQSDSGDNIITGDPPPPARPCKCLPAEP